MAQRADLIACTGGTVEASDLDEHQRRMDMDYSILRSDKPHVCYGTSGRRRGTPSPSAAIACGGREAIDRRPPLMGSSTPTARGVGLLMVDALTNGHDGNQPVMITPFLMAGATAPMTSRRLVLQVAEALSGVALIQAIRPGAPCLFGSFFTAVDMRSGAPALGTPESVVGTLAGGQLARRYGLPYRGGGGLCSGTRDGRPGVGRDADDAVGDVHAGSDFVLHAGGGSRAA